MNKLEKLAQKVCIFNGQKGTEKQIKKTLKGFGNNEMLINRYLKERGIKK